MRKRKKERTQLIFDRWIDVTHIQHKNIQHYDSCEGTVYSPDFRCQHVAVVSVGCYSSMSPMELMQRVLFKVLYLIKNTVCNIKY